MQSQTKIYVLVAAFFMLAASNLMTLMSDKYHAKAHNIIEVTLGRVIPMDHSTINRARQLETENKRLTDANVQLASGNAKLVAATRVLISATDALQAAHNRLALNHVATQKSAEVVRTTARSTIAKLWHRTTFGATRSVASLIPRATPAIGAAASLFALGLDLKDACDSLKDMNSLNESIGDPVSDSDKVCGQRVPTMAELKKLIPKLHSDN